MGILGKLKEIFKKDSSEELEKKDELINHVEQNQQNKQTEQPIDEQKPQVKDGQKYINEECSFCHKVVGFDRYSYQAGHYFHKKCYKKAKKLAFKCGGVMYGR